MKPISLAYPLHFFGLILFATVVNRANPALSQASDVVPDNTLGDESSVVNPRDANSESIDGGAVRGQNLFHSFEEFNVGEDRGVYFANPDAVTNIFSRVTGDNVSNIFGTLGVDGAANLFLINPNGIVFGEGASLDVQGSFTATTADGIEFGEQGFFSASDPGAPKLLTINPSAYLFNQVAPGAIANNSQSAADFNPATSFDDDFFGLRVPDAQSLLLLGGDLNFDGGGLVASGGRIDLGGIAGEGIVGLNNNGSLNIPDNIARGDISLTNGAGFLVAGDGGGDLAIAAKNIRIDSASTIEAGIYNNLGSLDAQAGDINLDATETISVKDDDSSVYNSIFAGATGKAGNLTIDTNDLMISDGGQIGTATFGKGDAGSLVVRASNIELEGTSSDGQFSSGLFTSIEPQAQGNSGNLTINTDSLSATNGGQINSFTRGQGDAGDITIQATDAVTFDGVDSDGYSSGSTNSVQAGGVGDGGNINITARSLSLTNGGQLDASVREAFETLPGGQGQGGNINIDVNDTLTISGENPNGILADLGTDAVGSAGNIDIQAGNLIVKDGGYISSSTFGQGNAGDITIQATDIVTFDGVDSDGNYSSVFSSVLAGAEGDGGDINITAASLSLTNGGQLEASVFGKTETLPGGQGQGGNINIDVNDTLTISGENPNGILADLGTDAVGSAGNIDIQAGNLIVKDGGEISSSTFGQGNAGDIIIQASDTVTFDGVDSEGNYSSVFSSVLAGAEGDGGDINITAGSLSLTNGGQLTASVSRAFDTFQGGKGQGGNININVDDTLTISGENPNGIFANLGAGAVGRAGNIDIQTGNLIVKDGGEISSSTFGQGDAGDITIQATEAVTFDGFDTNDNYSRSSSSVLAGGIGDGGNINITAGSLSLTDGSYLEASVREAFETLPGGQGQGGNINIDVDDTLTISGENALGIFARLEAGAVGNGGNIDIQTGNLIIRDGGLITSSTSGQGDSSNISITADNSISLDDSSIVNNVENINAVGNAGTIDITTGSLSATNGSQINSFTRGRGDAGDITIQAINTVTFDGFDNDENYSGLASTVEAGGEGDGGDINIAARSLSLTNGAELDASIRAASDSLPGGEGQGGNIKINVDGILTIADGDRPRIIASLGSGAVGSGGDIRIKAKNLVIQNSGEIDSSSFGQGNSGNVDITLDNALEANNAEISTSSNQSSGGEINITSGKINLRGDSNIRSNIFSGAGGGGNINITADSVIAFDDSDIFAFARDGRGGNITLDTSAFFAENFTLNSLTADPETLDNNSRADVNATGAVSGSVAIPDVSFIQNSLTELENNSINTDELVANSCVVPVGQRKQGKFIITGAESLPVRPGDGTPVKYPTGEVRNVPESNHSSWQPGDPIVEPQGAYRLANGKLVLSRQCSQ